MTPGSLLLWTLLLLSFCSGIRCVPKCSDQCCGFVEAFPVRLRRLRHDYSHIRDFYEANDDLDSALLDQSVQDAFRSPFACHTMSSILDFYLVGVLPRALDGVTEDTRDLKPHMESIQQILDQLRTDVVKCRHYFSCRNQFNIHNLNSTYTRMETRGLFKAMAELDLLFNYMENFLASNRRRG